VILMGAPLLPLPGLVRLSRQLARVITQGIYLFAFGVNGLGMLLSAWGVLSPVGGALFHEAASLAVMLNALRLLWFEGFQGTRAGSWLAGAQARVERAADALAPAALVQRMLRHRVVLFRLACAMALAAWCLWNLVILAPDEAAVVWRFGRYRQTLAAGLHWRWPPPWETVHRQPISRLRSVQVGFRGRAGETASAQYAQRPIEWQAEHADAGFQPVPAEALVLTGDELAVEVFAQANYQIARMRDYLEGSAAPELMLQSLTESALRQTMARLPLEAILAESRASVEEECLGLVREGCARYALGIDVVEIRLLDLHPPAAVVPAYRNVANALEEQEQVINLAHVASARHLLRSAGEQALVALAGQPRPNGRGATGLPRDLTNWQLDGRLWSHLVDESAGDAPLAGEAAARINAAHAARARVVGQSRGQQGRFDALVATHRHEARLTSVELFWQSMERALEGRSLTLLDPQASGRRHMILGDADRFNLFWQALGERGSAGAPAEPPVDPPEIPP
jgi:Cu+-exporting ATPase